jgi:TonB family protein
LILADPPSTVTVILTDRLQKPSGFRYTGLMALRTTSRWAAIGMLCVAWAVRSVRADDALPTPPASPILSSDAMTEPQLRAALAMLDAMRQALLKIRANAPALLQSRVMDERGRTFDDDWQAYCLTASDQADIQAQFSAISAALDGQDLESAGRQRQVLYHRLTVMGIQCKTIGDYWQDVVLHPPNWAPYLAMLRENGVERHYAANIASLERTLKLQARHGLFIDAIGGTLTQLEGIRGRGQQRDLKDLEGKARNPDFHKLYQMTPATVCTPVAARSSGKAMPAMDYSQPQPKLTYPEEAQRNREQGSVSVGLIVPPTGCAREGFVLGSSGYERLDRAAVSYAMSLHLLPAEEEGISVEALAVVPINFALRSP